MSKLKFFLSLIAFSLITIQCEDDPSFQFPYVHVDLILYIDTDLGNMVPGSIVFIENEGYGGIVIYRSGEDGNDYYAYDRACTYDFDQGCILQEDENFATILACPCCGSQFWVSIDGSVYNGPAKYPLKKYNTYLQGANILRVTNQ